MAKRRRRRRGARREPQQLPRPSRGEEPARRPDAAPTVAQADQTASSDPATATDRTVVGTVLEVERECIWIETEGSRALLYASELMLDIGEVPADRYAPGDRFEAFVFQMEPDPASGAPQFSIRRAAPYLDMLSRLEAGSVVAEATVVNSYDVGIELDIDGLRGNAHMQELLLVSDQSTHERYRPGDTVHSLFVQEVNHGTRFLELSARRGAPSYVEALNAHKVGDAVFGTITSVLNNGGLWLNVGGVVGAVAPQELSFADDEPASDRHAIGDTLHNLFVWRVNHDQRNLVLSIRRNAPGYVDALNVHKGGEIVSGTITSILTNGQLWLNVGEVAGTVPPDELTFADDEFTQDRYAVGDALHDLFVQDVDRDTRELDLSVRRNAPGYVDAFNAHRIGEIVSATVTALASDGGLWLDVDGVVGFMRPQEINLATGKFAQDRYAVGDTLHDLFIWNVDHDTRVLDLSARRNTPGYVEALDTHSVGDVVSATIAAFGHRGLWLSIGSVVGWIAPDELSLTDGESTRDRYTVGDTINDLFIWQVNHDARNISLSVRRNAPGYVEALGTHTVGDVVSATITDVVTDGGLWLDVGDVIGWMGLTELPLTDGGSPQDHYAVGDTLHDLFVWLIEHSSRSFSLSALRNKSSYVNMLDTYRVGDVVSATVTAFDSNDSLMLDVGGVIGVVSYWDLALTDGESARDRYAIGDTAHDLFVWQVNYNTRDLFLSVRRNTSAYVDAFTQVSVADPPDATVVEANEWGLWLEVGGVVGWIPTSELQLGDGESPADRYMPGDSVRAQVWQIDGQSRSIILSVRRLDPDFPEEDIRRGAMIDAVVRGSTPRGVRSPIRVLAANEEVWIPPHALSLSTSVPPPFKDGEVIRVVVIDLDEQGRPTELSHRRALEGWDAAVERLFPGDVVQNAHILPRAALPANEHHAALNLGPINGFIPEEELDRDAADRLTEFSANQTHPVVVEAVDRIRGIAIVSHEKFPARWGELAAGMEEGAEVEAELREVVEGVAMLDLGSGLLAKMPADQLPVDQTGATFSVRIAQIVPETYVINAEIKNYDLVQMIAADETLTCELKEGFVMSKGNETPRQRENRQKTNLSVVRAMAGMMNRNGGHVIVGVEDTDKKNGEVVGWRAGGFPNQNALRTALGNLIGEVLTPAAGGLYELRFETLPSSGPEILDIVCQPANEPIFLEAGNRGEFPVRYPAMTKNLTAADQYAYIRERFS